MSHPTRWNPIRQIARFDPVLEFEDLVRGLGLRSPSRPFEDALEMRMNVVEDDASYRVTIDVPGVRKEDIDVSIEGNQVSVTAELKREEKKESEKELCSERCEGRIYRAFTLPSEIDSDKATARCEGGVLSLTLPKKGGNHARKLPVN